MQPLVAFQPIPNPNTGAESEGAAEITMAPAHFPAGMNNGIFVGFHGRFFGANEENPVVYYDLATGEYFHFVGVNNSDKSHRNGLLSTTDSLFVSDMGDFLTANHTGAIFQIKSLVDFFGDMDGDGDVDNFDIQPFELALTDQAAYLAQYPLLFDFQDRGDIDGDGDFDNFDIQPFEALLTSGGAPVPEPGSALLLAVGGMCAVLLARRRSRRVALAFRQC